MSPDHPSTTSPDDIPDLSSGCLVCGSAELNEGKATFHKEPHPTLAYHECTRCGFVRLINNDKAFVSEESYERTARVGTDDSPGREYLMIKLGADILGRADLQVMITGFGTSRDYIHAAKLKRVAKVSVADFVNVPGAPNFYDLSKPIDALFDLLVAAEVVEHFPNPARDFHSLLSLIANDGMAICSTNIYDGTDLNKHWYPFIDGHNSYYTPDAIAHVAEREGVFFDFRVPVAATTFAGPRKRYIFFSRSSVVMQQVALYFGNHTYAPSEKEKERA